MSSAKSELDRREEMTDRATDIALKAGAIRECDLHEEMFIGRNDPAALQIAEDRARRLNKKQPELYDLDELLAAIKFAVDGAPERCPLCPSPSD